jgi:ferrochelatase
MKNDGVKRAIAFSQYPQFSCTTTGSSLNELTKILGKMDPERQMIWSIIDRWSLHSSAVNAFASTIQEALDKFSLDQRSKVLILFTAHSLPLSVIKRGDTYASEVCATAYAVMKFLGLKNPFRIIWQSQVGPTRWLGPQAQNAISEFARRVKYKTESYPGIILVPIAFTSDHIETLYELDHEYIEKDAKKNIGCPEEKIIRASALNDRPEFIEALATIVKDHIMEFPNIDGLHGISSPQYYVPCHECIDTDCLNSRKFFSYHEQKKPEKKNVN